MINQHGDTDKDRIDEFLPGELDMGYLENTCVTTVVNAQGGLKRGSDRKRPARQATSALTMLHQDMRGHGQRSTHRTPAVQELTTAFFMNAGVYFFSSCTFELALIAESNLRCSGRKNGFE